MIDDREVAFFSSRPARLLLALATICLMLVAGGSAFRHIWRQPRPEAVLAVFPGDPIAALNAGDRHWLAGAGDPQRSQGMALAASQALRSEPLTPSAIRLLGLAEDAESHPGTARDLMTLAHRLTRRDLATSFWLIHDSAARGDMEGTLRLYDEALLISSDSSDVLFRPLTKALFDPAVRHALSPYVRSRPTWMPRFLQFAAEAGETPDDVAKLVIEAGGLPATAPYDGRNEMILRRLAQKSSFAIAQIYLEKILGIPGRIAGAPGITPKTTNAALGPFGWQITDQPDIGATLDDHSGLQVRAAPDRRGVVARRILLADPGTYGFAQFLEFSPNTPASHLRWELRCLPAAIEAPIWAQDLPVHPAPGKYSFLVTIPDHCPAQDLTLWADGSNAGQEAQAEISNLDFIRR